MIRPRPLLTALALLSALAVPVSVAVAQSAPDKPDEKTFKKLSEFIQPDATESGWEKIGWRTDLEKAVEEAKELGRPILLWAMNGHPCGHT